MGDKFERSDSSTTCSAVYTATGKEGCAVIDYSSFYKFMYVFGAVEIIAGIILAFFGNKVFEYILFFLAFSSVFGCVFGLGFSFLNFFAGSMTPIIITVVIGVIAGALVAYFFKELVVNHGAMILGFMAGCIIGMMVVSPLGAKVPAVAKGIVMLLLGAVGAYTGFKFNLQIKIIALTLIGSGLIMHGVGQYAGGFPPMSVPEGDEKYKPSAAYIGYVVGFLVVGAAGWYVQSKTNDPEEYSKEGNAFNEDEE